MNEKTKLVSEIIMLAMKVQDETEHCVFINVSGHVEKIEIQVTASKNDYHNKIAESEFRMGERASIERLNEAKDTLLSFIEDGVNTDELDYWVEEIKHYTF